METHQRGARVIGIADDERHVLAHVVRLAEGDDLGIVQRGDRQPGAGGDGKVRRVRPVGKVCRLQPDRFASIGGIGQEGGQYARDPRQFQRRLCLGHECQRLGSERAFQRCGKIERRVSHHARFHQ